MAGTQNVTDRETQIWIKIEGTYASDPTPAATDALHVMNLKWNANAVMHERPQDGDSWERASKPAVIGRVVAELEFDVWGQSNSVTLAAGVEPVIGPLLRCCRFVGAWDTDHWDYTLLGPQTSPQSVTIYLFDGGMKWIITGLRGNMTWKLVPGDPWLIHCKLQGLYSDVVEAATPTPNYTAEPATCPIICGAGFQPWSEAPANDTPGHILDMEVDLRNRTKLLASNTVAAANCKRGLAAVKFCGTGSGKDYGAALKFDVEQKATDPDDWWVRSEDRVNSGAATYDIGTAANNRFRISFPAIEIAKLPEQSEADGVRIHKIDGRVVGALSVIAYKLAP
jgi:hypothetical protein